MASAANQFFPSGGASTYARLAWIFKQRGVRGGQASLVALIDTLSYAVATATLLGGWLCWLQRTRERFIHFVLRLERRVTSLLGARSHARAVRELLDDYYAGKGPGGRCQRPRRGRRGQRGPAAGLPAAKGTDRAGRAAAGGIAPARFAPRGRPTLG